MTMSDPLGDMLTRIRNGQMARKSVISRRILFCQNMAKFRFSGNW